MIVGWLIVVLFYVFLIVIDFNYKRILLIWIFLICYIYYRKVWNKIVFKIVIMYIGLSISYIKIKGFMIVFLCIKINLIFNFKR